MITIFTLAAASAWWFIYISYSLNDQLVLVGEENTSSAKNLPNKSNKLNHTSVIYTNQLLANLLPFLWHLHIGILIYYKKRWKYWFFRYLDFFPYYCCYCMIMIIIIIIVFVVVYNSSVVIAIVGIIIIILINSIN